MEERGKCSKMGQKWNAYVGSYLFEIFEDQQCIIFSYLKYKN